MSFGCLAAVPPSWFQICPSSKMWLLTKTKTYADVNKAYCGAIKIRDRWLKERVLWLFSVQFFSQKKKTIDFQWLSLQNVKKPLFRWGIPSNSSKLCVCVDVYRSRFGTHLTNLFFEKVFRTKSKNFIGSYCFGFIVSNPVVLQLFSVHFLQTPLVLCRFLAQQRNFFGCVIFLWREGQGAQGTGWRLPSASRFPVPHGRDFSAPTTLMSLKTLLERFFLELPKRFFRLGLLKFQVLLRRS